MKNWLYEYLGADGIIPQDAPASNLYFNPPRSVTFK